MIACNNQLKPSSEILSKLSDSRDTSLSPENCLESNKRPDSSQEYMSSPNFYYNEADYCNDLNTDIEKHYQLISDNYDDCSASAYQGDGKLAETRITNVVVEPTSSQSEIADSDHRRTAPEAGVNSPSVETNENSGATKPKRLYAPNLVVQQNRLLESFKDLDLYERRLLLYLSSTVRSEVHKNPSQDTFLVHILDFARTFGLEKGKYLNGFMRKSGDRMQNKKFVYPLEIDGYVDTVSVNVAFRFRYRERTDQMWVSLPSEVINMLTVFDKEHPFTYYELGDVVKMKNQNTITLFELLAQYRKVKKRKLSVEYMRTIFGCEDKYPLITDFMRYVVKKSVKEINELTGFKVDTVIEKNGATPVAVTFTFVDTKQEMREKGKELALVDFGYTTESEIAKHNENKALKLTESQLRRIVTRKKFVADHQLPASSPQNANMMVYYDYMVDRLLKDASFVVKHTLEYYLEQTENAS